MDQQTLRGGMPMIFTKCRFFCSTGRARGSARLSVYTRLAIRRHADRRCQPCAEVSGFQMTCGRAAALGPTLR